MDSTLKHWLTLLHTPGLGPVGAIELLGRYGSLAGIFEHGPSDPRLEAGLRARLRRPDQAAIDADQCWLEGGDDRHILGRDDPRYPPQLSALRGAPLVLFVHGQWRVLSEPQLAMVGSRNPTALGEETAFDFARQLALNGLVITSGLALGVDAASHSGALAAGGQTVAVGGTGPDRVYPARNRDLAHAIVDGGGALVSEFPPGTGPSRGNFPRRNRIISGLSLGVLVVEATPKSGSLITARLAAEQDREVLAIPGSIHNPLARGCNQLIRQGAKLVETASDIVEELALPLRTVLADNPSQTPPPEADEELDSDYQNLLRCLDHGPVAVDLLVERSGLTAEAVSSMLLFLELQGYVAPASGGGYSRTSKRA